MRWTCSCRCIGSLALLSCASHGVAPAQAGGAAPRVSASVRPGITVLLSDSIGLIRGKRIGLLTNQTGIDEHGTSDIDLLARFTAASGDSAGGARLAALFSPEHGIRGTEDRLNIVDGRDQRTGVPLYSLYGATVLAPPDSALRQLDVLVIDLQDLGTRCWTYVASVVYAMRAAAANGVRVVVLDRPNPITGLRAEGPVLDSTIAWSGSHTPGRPAKPTALFPIPLRHGLTMGELARYYNDAMSLHADLHVVPMQGWTRALWFDETGLPWVKPSPNMPSLLSALLYPAVVNFEGTNLSVGRGTPDAFQHIGAPWLDARKVVDLLTGRSLPGVRFEVERFTPMSPTDKKFDGVRLNGVRIVVTDRNRLEAGRLGATLLWAVARANKDSLRFNLKGFDELFGSPAAREALVRGDDPDQVVERAERYVPTFERATAPYRLYQ